MKRTTILPQPNSSEFPIPIPPNPIPDSTSDRNRKDEDKDEEPEATKALFALFALKIVFVVWARALFGCVLEFLAAGAGVEGGTAVAGGEVVGG
jgi:hypothetical protein